MKLNKVKMVAIVISSLVVTSAFADDFNVSNQTKYQLSFQVNGSCSPDFGTLYPYAIKNIAEKTFINACKSNMAPCEIKVYGADSCKGQPLLMVQYYTSDKFVSLYQYNSDIHSGVSGYNLFLSDLSNLKKK